MVQKAEAAPLSVQEANELLEKPEVLNTIISNIMKQEDLNSDGKISLDEFMKNNEEQFNQNSKDEL